MRRFRALVARLEEHPRAWQGVLVVAALVVLHGRTLLGHVQMSLDRFRFNDDVRVLIHPQFRWEDARLFPHDPAVDYFLASLPEGYRLVYRALGPLVGVTALSKALPYVLLAVVLACLARVAGRLSGAAAVLGALSLALGSAYVLGRMVGGLPRGFALPFLAAGALALVEGRARTLALLAVVAAGFYPAVGLTLGAALALLFCLPARDRGSAETWSVKKRGGWLALTGLLAVLIVAPTVWRLRPWGPAIGPELIGAYPEAGPNGRFDPMDRAPFPALPEAAVLPMEAALVGDGEAPIPALSLRKVGGLVAASFVFVGLCGWAVRARRRSDARRILLLPAALTLCHTLAWLLEPRLFLPERYVAYAVPLVALLAAPTALGALRDGAAGDEAAHEGARRWQRFVPLAYNAVLLVALGATGVTWSGLSVYVPPPERPLYEKLATLPPNALIAAIPSDAIDSIPYLTRRSVLFTRETHMPFHVGYAELMRRRARALYAAYFSPSVAELARFTRQWGVTHVLFDRRHASVRPTYFAPFDADIAAAFDRGKAEGFAMTKLPANATVFEAGPYLLIDATRL
ncbi:MAG TPA: hypothetical protein VFV94_09750 [Polyangiaceae bacterium]|nr:hypothetical protein [Polyangiaceae bacterium]